MPETVVNITVNHSKIQAKVARLQAELREKMLPTYEQEARRLQEAQQEVLKERIDETGRPQIRNNFLIEAVIAPENREVGRDGFTVGIALATGRAGPYFRMIDQGSRKFVGRVLLGFFLDGSGRRMPPRTGAHDAGRLIQFKKQEPLEQGGGLRNTEGRFRSPSAKLKKGEKAHEARKGSGAFVIHIRNPIPRYNYIRGGMENWIEGGGKARIAAAIRQNARRVQ